MLNLEHGSHKLSLYTSEYPIDDVKQTLQLIDCADELS